MPKQIVFVAGHSATGKKTFIDKVFSPEGADLRERFRLTGKMERLGAGFEAYQWHFTRKLTLF